MSRKISGKALETARKQFCLDIQMPWEMYCQSPHQKVYLCKAQKKEWIPRQGARQFGKEDIFFRAIICMGQLFLLVDEAIYEWALQEFSQCSPQWFCSFDNLRKIDKKLREYGYLIKDTHLYYLPAEDVMMIHTEPLTPVQWFEEPEILAWKGNNRFTSAVSFWPNMPDVLAVAAMEDGWRCEPGRSRETGQSREVGQKQEVGKNCEREMTRENAKTGCREKDFDQSHMLGMAGASADGEYLWQIGIDVAESRRCGGLATNLVQLMKEEVLRRGKIPFYGTSESHTISQSVAYHAGFMPGWAEVYAKRID